MARRIPKSFFWIDQKLIRGGLWIKLTQMGKLFYVALSATADREGRCHWGRVKLAELAGGVESDFKGAVEELAGHGLVKMGEELGVVEILNLEDEHPVSEPPTQNPKAVAAPIVVQTHLTVNLGEHVKR